MAFYKQNIIPRKDSNFDFSTAHLQSTFRKEEDKRKGQKVSAKTSVLLKK